MYKSAFFTYTTFKNCKIYSIMIEFKCVMAENIFNEFPKLQSFIFISKKVPINYIEMLYRKKALFNISRLDFIPISSSTITGILSRPNICEILHTSMVSTAFVIAQLLGS